MNFKEFLNEAKKISAYNLFELNELAESFYDQKTIQKLYIDCLENVFNINLKTSANYIYTFIESSNEVNVEIVGNKISKITKLLTNNKSNFKIKKEKDLVTLTWDFTKSEINDFKDPLLGQLEDDT